MLKKTLIIATLGTALAAGTLSTSASAQGDPLLGALIGGGIGAAIGHSVNGVHGAWAGGAIGAVTGAAIAGAPYNGGGYYGPPGAYVAPAPAPAYYGPAPYYRPAPAYYAPPVVYPPRPVVYGRPYYAPRYVAYGGYGYRYGGHPSPYAYQGH